MKKPLLAFLCILLFSSTFALASAEEGTPGEGFKLYPTNPNAKDPASLIYELRPGESKKDMVTIMNNGTSTKYFELYPVDKIADNAFSVNPTDKQLQKEAIAEAISKGIPVEEDDSDEEETTIIRDIISIEDDKHNLEPGIEKVIQIFIKIPEDAEYGIFRGGIAFEKRVPSRQKGLVIATRFIQPVIIKVTDTPEKIMTLAEANALRPTPYLWASVAIFLASMGYLIYANKKDKKAKGTAQK